MLRNYLIITLRNLRKHFTYSLINILGLGLGLATCLLLVTWICQELSYDRFHQNSDRIYRASLEYGFGGQISRPSVSPTALLPALQKNFPEVENGVRTINSSFIVRNGEKVFQESRFLFADSTFFEVFSFSLLEGSVKHSLVEPNSVVLSQSMARKYFGDENPSGKELQMNNGTTYKVTGLMQDVPANSLLQFDFVASFSSLEAAGNPIWWTANYQTFLLLTPQADVAGLQEKTNALVKKELASELTSPGDYVRYNFMPMRDIYLYSDMSESVPVSSIYYVYGFGGIGILILLIACINYINLATAKAADRAKEVSVRKVVGAMKKQLFFQFIGESLIITFLAFLFASLLAQLALPLFNSITGKNILPGLLLAPSFLFYCLIVVFLIAFAAGAYPAFAISSFRPATVLKGNFRSSGRGIWLRKSLVVFQFCVSIVLIVGTIVILKQLNYIQHVRLGYDKENVVILPLDRKTAELYPQLREQFMQSGKVIQMGRAGNSPTQITGGYTIAPEGSTSDRGMMITAMNADTTFIPTLGIKLIAGRNFNDLDTKKYHADTTVSFILNESALKEMSIDIEKAVGLRVDMNGRKGSIVGVVKDFHFSSLHERIRPLALFNEEFQNRLIFVKLTSGSVSDALAVLKNISETTLPHRPFEYEFLDQKYSQLYNAEDRIGLLSTVFASLAIIIACLGLLGLVAFSAAQKTKEIGIRKVMGATASNIVVIITKEYFTLIIISVVIGLPLANFLITKWFLSSFVYRTTVGLWPFVAATLSCILIAFLTASYQAAKAAFINPSETLRSE
jgi:putative ABC transport system permease protein